MSASTCCCSCRARASSPPSMISTRRSATRRAAGSTGRPGHRHQRRRQRPHRHSLRRQRQPAAAPQGPARAGRLCRSAQDLGRAGHPGHGRQQGAGLRLGLALSNVGDANVQVNVLQSYGGRIADDAGKKVTIKSEATRTYLTWLKDAGTRACSRPAIPVDRAGDNQAYLSGQGGLHRQYRFGRHRRQEG